MKIFLLTVGDRSRASSRLRVWDHVDWLSSQGHRVIADYVMPPGVQRITWAVALRIITRWPIWIWQFLSADRILIQEVLLLAPVLVLKRLGKSRRLIFDFSDPVDTIGSGLRNRLQRLGFAAMTRGADHVQVENVAYQSDLRKCGLSVSQFYGPVNAARYRKSANNQCKLDRQNDSLRIGWTGSPGTLTFIEPLFPILDDLARTYPIELMLIGVTRIDYRFSNLKVLPVRWTEDDEFKLVPSFDLGLFALGSDEKSKRRGAGKIFVYMASGVPFIASRIGIAIDVIRDSASGFSVPEPDEWRAVLERAFSGTAARREMAAKASHFAQARMSYEAYRAMLQENLLHPDGVDN